MTLHCRKLASAVRKPQNLNEVILEEDLTIIAYYTTRHECYWKICRADAPHLLDRIMSDLCAWRWASRGHSAAGGRMEKMMPRCEFPMQCRAVCELAYLRSGGDTGNAQAAT